MNRIIPLIKLLAGVIIGVFIALVLIGSVAAAPTPQTDTPCRSLYDKISPAACPYAQQTVNEFEQHFLTRYRERLLKNAHPNFNSDLLADSIQYMADCLINRVMVNFTEAYYLEWIRPYIVNGMPTTRRVHDFLVEHTNVCALAAGLVVKG